MPPYNPDLLADLANPSLDEDSGFMLKELGNAIFDELDELCSTPSTAIDSLAAVARDILRVAESRRIGAPSVEQTSRTPAEVERALGLSVNTVHPPTPVQLSALGEPASECSANIKKVYQQPLHASTLTIPCGVMKRVSSRSCYRPRPMPPALDLRRLRQANARLKTTTTHMINQVAHLRAFTNAYPWE